MKRENERMKPTGTTVDERWYTLARTHMAIIANRERTQERCKHCFKMWFNPGEKKYMPRHGCGGCAEMETFMKECRAFFADGGAGTGKGARNDR